MDDTETFFDPNTQRNETRKTQSDDTTAKATGVQAGFSGAKLPSGAKTVSYTAPGKPKREDFPSGLGGEGKYSMAVRNWQSSSKPDTGKEQRDAIAGQ